jgi:cation diffusion facilitator CzcD-associated flavoprotein CzcO
MENFCRISNLQGAPGEEDLVKDGWTEMSKRFQKAIASIPPDQRTPQTISEAMENSDHERMSEIRNRTDQIVQDPQKASALKAWYRTLCKRPAFHDEYLSSFNRPNVHLIDCSASKGVERITERGLVANGKLHEVDCIVFASGFDASADADPSSGFDIIGRGGRTLAQHFEQGMRSLHGMHVNGFPNLFLSSLAQNSSFSTNVPHNYVMHGKILGAIVSQALSSGNQQVEVTAEAEDEWTRDCVVTPWLAPIFQECTPGYYNNEGKSPPAVYFGYPKGPVEYFKYIEGWIGDGKFSGLSFAPARTSSKCAPGGA